MAAVQANAYGHGLVHTARELAHADALAVARLIEAERLRDAGIATDIVLMAGVLDDEELRQAATLRCDLVVHTEQQVALLERVAVDIDRVWLKIDTGMHRLGVDPQQADSLLDRLRACVGTIGLMTHMANADNPDDPMTARQLGHFLRLSENFDGDISIANSALLVSRAGELGERQRFGHTGSTWVRPGIGLYGISPLTGQVGSDLGLRPVMQFETMLVDVKAIRRGERVGYGGIWAATEDTQLGVAAAGYGDGYSRFIPPGTPVLVNGRRVSLAGVVSMDLLAVDSGLMRSIVSATPSCCGAMAYRWKKSRNSRYHGLSVSDRCHRPRRSAHVAPPDSGRGSAIQRSVCDQLVKKPIFSPRFARRRYR